MPTGNCKFPEHHGPSGRPLAGWVAALIAGALIIAEWRVVVVILAVVAALIVAGVAVLMLFHSHRAVPYDAAWDDRQSRPVRALASQSQPVTAQVIHVHQHTTDTRTAALTAEVAALRAQLAARQLEAPQQHLHIHGVAAEDLAPLYARPGYEQPAIEERP